MPKRGILFSLILLAMPVAADAREASLYSIVEPELPTHVSHLQRRFAFYGKTVGQWLGITAPAPVKLPEMPVASAAAVRPPVVSAGPKEPFYKFPSSTPFFLDHAKFGACLARATAEEFPRFRFDRSQMRCTWNIEGERFVYKRADKPSFMTYLGGLPRKCDYTSGKEDELRAWVFAQPENSINPVSLYRASLRLNDGNVWNALLAIHQVLRQQARYGDYKRYNFRSDRATARDFFNRFIDIRGDLIERGPGFSGDHAGSWYRMWGAILFRMMPHTEEDFLVADDPAASVCLNGERSEWKDTLADFTDEVMASAVFFGDEAVLKMHSGKDKLGKFLIDRNASNSVRPFAQGLRAASMGFALPGPSAEACAGMAYLKKKKWAWQ